MSASLKKVHISKITVLIIIIAVILASLLYINFKIAKTYNNETKLKESICKIISEKTDESNIQVEGIEYIKSKVALYYTYDYGSGKKYATGLFEKKFYPPYVKANFLSESEQITNLGREPYRGGDKENINILFIDNPN